MVTAKTLPALLALLESAVAAQPSGNSLQADPLIDEYRQAKRRAMAITLCQNGVNGASWELANRLAQSWGMSCSMFGIDRPAEDGDRRQRVVKR